MRGRKPKYPQEEIDKVSARLAAGESPSALAKELGWPRTSIIRCSDSARAPSEVTAQARQNIKDKKATQRERLFWRFIEENLRQGIAKASQAAPKEIAAMLESAVKLKALMTSSGSAARAATVQFTDETILKFGHFIKGEVVVPPPAEEAVEANLGEAKADAIEIEPEDTTPPSDQGEEGQEEQESI